jgi:Domain of unknown function (DUF2828)
MAALIRAIDSYTPMQIGENGHVEHTWSNDLREKLVQFSFQVTRCDDTRLQQLSVTLRNWLMNTKGLEKESFLELTSVAYKMIAHTRDIIDGKGEYSLAYMQLLVWNEFYPKLAIFMLKQFVQNDNSQHPFGSWKDIKYFCNYARSKGLELESPLMQYAFDLVISQLKFDVESKNKSLLAKWVPRSKSTKFGWIFNELALRYFSQYLVTARSPKQIEGAKKKAYMEFRKLISAINAELDTVQIKQCSNSWASIDHTKTTSITISKQKKAFLNLNKNGTQRCETLDRIQCADNFKQHIENAVKGEVEIKGKRVGLNDFTAQAVELIRKNGPDVKLEIDLLNAQWKNNASQTGALCEMIAMLDFSGSMSGDPLNCAMALGCRVAEKSKLGRRVLSFSNNPTWHNLDGCTEFVDMIRVLQYGEVGYSTNFYKAFETILTAIITNKLPPEDVENMVLAIFSDMQINDPNVKAPANMDSFYDEMVKKYADAGMRLWNKPFNPPHILFWNLRSTNGFPVMSTAKNVSMMSGFSPALLNMFCEKGIDAFKDCTPWSILKEQLNNPRYKCLDDKVIEEFIF